MYANTLRTIISCCINNRLQIPLHKSMATSNERILNVSDPVDKPKLKNAMMLPRRTYNEDFEEKNKKFLALSQVTYNLDTSKGKVCCKLKDGNVHRTRGSRDLARCILACKYAEKHGYTRVWSDALSMPYEIDEYGEGVKNWCITDMDTHVPSRRKMKAIGQTYALADKTLAILDRESVEYINDIYSAVSGMKFLPKKYSELLAGEAMSSIDSVKACTQSLSRAAEYGRMDKRLWILGPFSYWCRAWTAQEQHASRTICYVKEYNKNEKRDVNYEDKSSLSFDDYVKHIEFREIVSTDKLYDIIDRFGKSRDIMLDDYYHKVNDDATNDLQAAKREMRQTFMSMYEDIRNTMERLWELLAGTEQTQCSRSVLYKDLSMQGVAAHTLSTVDKFASTKDDLIAALAIMLKLSPTIGNKNEAWHSIQEEIVDLGNIPFPNSYGGLHVGNNWRVNDNVYARIGSKENFSEKYWSMTFAERKMDIIDSYTEDEPFEFKKEKHEINLPSEKDNHSEFKKEKDKINVNYFRSLACSTPLKTFMHRASEVNNVFVNRNDQVCIKPDEIMVKVTNIRPNISIVCKTQHDIEPSKIPIRWDADITIYNIEGTEEIIQINNRNIMITHGLNVSKYNNKIMKWNAIDDLLVLLDNERDNILMVTRLTLNAYRKIRDTNNRQSCSGYRMLNYGPLPDHCKLEENKKAPNV